MFLRDQAEAPDFAQLLRFLDEAGASQARQAAQLKIKRDLAVEEAVLRAADEAVDEAMGSDVTSGEDSASAPTEDPSEPMPIEPEPELEPESGEAVSTAIDRLEGLRPWDPTRTVHGDSEGDAALVDVLVDGHQALHGDAIQASEAGSDEADSEAFDEGSRGKGIQRSNPW